MASEAKKLALLRILEILQRNTDEAHPLTHNEIADMLLKNYGIEIERKAVGRNISLLLEADYDTVMKPSTEKFENMSPIGKLEMYFLML